MHEPHPVGPRRLTTRPM